jgi:nicotinate-nucleotide--dimethylbenzimidazole phosphoribosyltransferase
MGIANTTAASAMCLALFGGSAADWVGPGTGVDGERLQRKIAIVEAAVGRNRPAMRDPFEVLRCLGGLELAAIVGAILAARMGRVPVVLDGFACTAAAAVLFAADRRALDHCVVAHRSTEPGHARLLAHLWASTISMMTGVSRPRWSGWGSCRRPARPKPMGPRSTVAPASFSRCASLTMAR